MTCHWSTYTWTIIREWQDTCLVVTISRSGDFNNKINNKQNLFDRFCGRKFDFLRYSTVQHQQTKWLVREWRDPTFDEWHRRHFLASMQSAEPGKQQVRTTRSGIRDIPKAGFLKKVAFLYHLSIVFNELFGLSPFPVSKAVAIVDLTAVPRVSFQFNSGSFLFGDIIVRYTGLRMWCSLTKSSQKHKNHPFAIHT